MYQYQRNPKRKEMTPQQRKFVDAYLLCGCVKSAAIEAGYSPDTATFAGSRVLKKKWVKLYMDNQVKKIEEKFGIDFDWKVGKLKQCVELGMPAVEEVKFLSLEEKALLKPAVAISAIAELNKMQGDYAPVKSETVNTHIVDGEIRELTEQYKRDY